MKCARGGGNYLSILAEHILFQLMPHCIIVLPCTTMKKYGKLLVQVFYEGAEMLCRCLGDGVRKGKAKPPAAEHGQVCEGQQTFHRYTSCKRRIRGSVWLLLSGTRIRVTKDMEKAEVFHVSFALVSTEKTILWDCRPLMPVGNAKAMKINPWIRSLKIRSA